MEAAAVVEMAEEAAETDTEDFVDATAIKINKTFPMVMGNPSHRKNELNLIFSLPLGLGRVEMGINRKRVVPHPFM